MRFRVAAIGLLCLSVLSSSARGAEEKPDAAGEKAALDAAKAYTALFKKKEALKAIETYWSFDGLFADMFGEDLKKHSPAEVGEMKTLMLGFLKKIYANPQITEMMANATYSDFSAKTIEGKRVRADFIVELNPETKLPNALVFQKMGDKWMVVDAGVQNKMIVPAIRQEYRAAKVTPLQFVKALVAGLP